MGPDQIHKKRNRNKSKKKTIKEDDLRKILEQEEAYTKKICDGIQGKYLDLMQKTGNQPKEVVKEGENEAKRVVESKTEGIMGEEKKVMELLEVVKDSTVLKGIMINKDVTPLR